MSAGIIPVLHLPMSFPLAENLKQYHEIYKILAVSCNNSGFQDFFFMGNCLPTQTRFGARVRLARLFVHLW